MGNARYSFNLAASLLLMLPVLGCGRGSEIPKAVVYGTVSYDGQPISQGKIYFYPIDGTPGGVSGGPINEGKYEATGKGGVPVGRHRVQVQGFRAPASLPDGEAGAPEQYVPEKYNRSSELTFEVPSGQRRVEHNLALTP
ncbi:hypothetical protein [Aeoliella sp.]|uniref:hypothetical protein n=1 Tax=Aeoliella sp. TaxID=2795800 RepID=UPI003CCB9B86